MPTIFRPGRAPKSKVLDARPSPRLRGYDARWDRRSAAYRRKHPFCERCRENDRLTFAAVVDHKFPVQDGGDVHCPDSGLWALCIQCHGWKAGIEDYARKNGLLDQVVTWCDRPETRPVERGDTR